MTTKAEKAAKLMDAAKRGDVEAAAKLRAMIESEKALVKKQKGLSKMTKLKRKEPKS